MENIPEIYRASYEFYLEGLENVPMLGELIEENY